MTPEESERERQQTRQLVIVCATLALFVSVCGALESFQQEQQHETFRACVEKHGPAECKELRPPGVHDE